MLKLRHVIVCGHYWSGGVRDERAGVADNWLRPVPDIRKRHQQRIDGLPDKPAD